MYMQKTRLVGQKQAQPGVVRYKHATIPCWSATMLTMKEIKNVREDKITATSYLGHEPSRLHITATDQPPRMRSLQSCNIMADPWRERERTMR